MKNFFKKFLVWFNGFSFKHKIYILLLLLMSTTLFSGNIFRSNSWFVKENIAINTINEELSNIDHSISNDTIRSIKRELLLDQIKDKLINYLFSAKNFDDLSVLQKYFSYVPRILEDIPSIVPLKSGEYNLSSSFGLRYHPIKHKNKLHSGVDLAAELNQKVFATANGTVVAVKHDNDGYGKHIIIKHRYGFKSLYGHLNTILVRKNQKVNQYTLIGTVGSTGSSTGNHLHYEVLKNGHKINPFYSFNLKKDILLNQ